MENKIMFLLIVILCLYLLFSKKGQEVIGMFTGKTISSLPKTEIKEVEKFKENISGDFAPNGVRIG